VIINSTIMAGDGSRMSKSKGNVVDPLDMIERYGADAVRAWAGAVGTAGQDMRFDENRIASYRLFANKLWNATRLLVTRLGDGERIAEAPEVDPATLHPEDRWILARVAETVTACDAAIAAYRFHEVMERLYDLTWRGYCDWYVEMIKGRLGEDADPASRAAAVWTSVTVLDTLLRLLHPLMPFVTEECAVRLPGAAPTLQRREWPAPPSWWREGANGAVAGVERVIELVGALRNARQQAGLPPGFRERQQVTLRTPDDALSAGDLRRLVQALVPVEVVDELSEGTEPVRLVAGGVEAALRTGGASVDRPQLEKQLRQAEGQVARFTAQLDNPRFLEGAASEVVERTRRLLAEAIAQRDTLRRLLDQG
jgi:valyl-tRNA synthetase